MILKRKAKAVIASIMCAAMIFATVGCSSQEQVAQEPQETKVEDTTIKVDDKQATDEVEEEVVDPNALEPGMMRSCLSGLPVDEKIGNRRPIAIMLNNLQAAQPMTGVSRADVVYEYVVEGAITRFMALFENYDDLEKIGSVRSCREYFVYTALEFDAVYMHFGQAAYALSILGEDYVDNLNGLGEAGDTSFYRTSDRNAPHNVYTSAKGIEAGIKKLGYREDHYDGYKGKFKFCDLDKVVTNEDGIPAKHLEPKYRINKPWFEYNEETQKYDRYQYDGPQIDDMTGEQLSYDNVIFQYNFWTQLDEKDYLAFDCHSGGVFQYFTHGKCVVGKWQRELNEDNYNMSAIRYYDTDGNELEINNGKTFVCVIQNTEVENVVIE